MSTVSIKPQKWLSLRQSPILYRKSPRPNVVWTAEQILKAVAKGELLSDLDRTIERLNRLSVMANTPIIGVLGEVNAGKSSVVASFLSPKGRARLPRGLEEERGTHRFIYWCPSAWRDDREVDQALRELLTQAHGQAPELLSDSPEVAFEQYRSGRDAPNLIPKPLLAYDKNLKQFALLDCPDVQTEDPPGLESVNKGVETNHRLNFVTQAAQVCSAFLFVWDRAQIRDRLANTMLARLRTAMSSVPIYLLVNKVRRQPNVLQSILRDSDIQKIRERFGVRDLYVALDFEIVGWKEFTPSCLLKSHDSSEPIPIFFRLDPKTARDPKSAPPQISLQHMLTSLEPAQLQRQVIASQKDLLRRQAEDMRSAIAHWRDDCLKNTRDIYQGLFRFCIGVCTDRRGEPMQFYDRIFLERLEAAVRAKAPWYVKAALWLNNLVKAAKESIVESIKEKLHAIGLLKDLSVLRTEFSHLAEGFFTPEELARNIRDRRWIPDNWDNELTQIWQQVLQGLKKYHQDVPDSEFDAMAADYWKHSGWKERAKSGLVLLASAASVGGLVTAAIDGGATLLASYSLGGYLATHLPGQMALGVGIIGTGAAFSALYAGIINNNSLPHIAAFFSLACDAFGLPRRLDNTPLKATFGRSGSSREFVLPDVNPTPVEPLHPLSNVGLWEWTPESETFFAALSGRNLEAPSEIQNGVESDAH